ncbi:MAG: hypothetical protein HYZ15_06550 [Sphingobacteriales bacterium]|nr:hypothetical protein [Sphingobacteriales bacterium]
MKARLYQLLLLFILITVLGTCRKDEAFVICANRCTSSAPWRVESLDLGLPCFATRSECDQWAAANGYGGKPCVKCD